VAKDFKEMYQQPQRKKQPEGPKPRLSFTSLSATGEKQSLTSRASKFSVQTQNDILSMCFIFSIGLELKKVAKRLAGKYACGCSVVKMPAGHEEVSLQGDFIDDLTGFLPKEYPEIKPQQIEVVIK